MNRFFASLHRAALLFALATLGASSASAVQVDDTDTDDNLRARVTSAWPTGITHGYVPVTLEIENLDEGRGCVVDIELSNERRNGPSAFVQGTAVLAEGETVVRDFLLPCSNTRSSSWRVELRSSRNERVDNLGFSGFGGQSDSMQHFVLVAVPPGAAPPDTAQWAQRLKTADLEAEEPTFEWHMGSRSMVQTPPTEPGPNAQVSSAQFGELPSRALAYSSLDAVLIDTRDGLPSEAHLAPLLEWARQGGTLALVGANAHELARQHPALGPWMEERFARFGAASNRPSSSAFHIMHGTLVLSASDELQAESHDLLREAMAAPSSWIPTRYGTKAASPALELPGFEELPFNGLIFFLIVFAVLVGPVNFALARKLGRMHLTLLTIPATSLIACGLLLGYAFLSQGIDAKLARESWTVLDQRTHRADTAEVRLFWAGLSPGGGLRPEAGTSIHPGFIPNVRYLDERTQYRLDSEDGMLLSGEFLPTRKATRQVVLTERAARGRLAFKRSGSGWSVQNGFESELSELVVRSAEGSYWHLSEPLAPDASASLQGLERDAAAAWTSEFSDGIPVLGSINDLPPAAYAAHMTDSPFGDDLGVEWTELSAQHRLYGIVAQAELTP